MAANWRIDVDCGADFRDAFTSNDVNGEPLNLTGHTARMNVARDYAAAAPVLTLTSPLGGLSVNGPAGTITVDISNEQTDALSGRYVFDLETISPSGFVTRMLEGTLVAKPKVPRAP